MTWYYKDGDQEIGPVNKAQLQDLIKTKRITGNTLLRSTESDEWRPLTEMVRPKAQSGTGQPTPSANRAPTGAPAQQPVTVVGPATPSAVCSQCGRSFPQDQVVTFDDQVICAACKPMFVQRLREGVTVPGLLKYGGFWIRFGAKLIDGLILAVIQYAIIIPLSIMAFSSSPSISKNPEDLMSSGIFMIIAIQYLIAITIPAVYNTFFVGRFAATPGKMACRLKIVTPENGRVSYLRALGRNFAEWISAFTFTIGYIIAAFDSEKRSLHDRIASTRVIYK